MPKLHELLEEYPNGRFKLPEWDNYITWNYHEGYFYPLVVCDFECRELRDYCPSVKDLLRDDWELVE